MYTYTYTYRIIIVGIPNIVETFKIELLRTRIFEVEKRKRVSNFQSAKTLLRI